MNERFTDLKTMTAVELAQLYEWKTLSPVEVCEEVLERCHRLNPKVNAFSLINDELALEAARASEKRWQDGEPLSPIDGVPATVKDIMPSRDWPTFKGSLTVSENQPLDEDAPVVQRLRENGAVLIGATTTPEFGWKGVTDSPRTGVTRNPWDVNKTPGGSSGGAAAAAALGLGVFHVGTDGGGSVRIPAGFTGMFGFKPTFGRVPVYPASVFGSVSHIGPITRTVEDAAVMMNTIIVPDSRDASALPYDPWNYQTGLDLGVKYLRIAYSPDLGYVDVDPEVAELVEKAVRVLENLGATVEQVDPGFANPHDCFNSHWYFAAKRLLDGIPEKDRTKMDPGLLEIAEAGRAITIDHYADAMDERVQLSQTMSRFYDCYDVLITPTLPIAAFDAGVEVPVDSGFERWTEWTPFTYPFNLTGQPACSVPCGFHSSGLPVAMQLIGPRYQDPLVMRVAAAYEAAQPFRLPETPA